MAFINFTLRSNADYCSKLPLSVSQLFVFGLQAFQCNISPDGDDKRRRSDFRKLSSLSLAVFESALGSLHRVTAESDKKPSGQTRKGR